MATLFEKHYRRAKGAHLAVPPNIAGRYLESVESKYKSLTTSNLVKEVEKDGPKGPVGPCFTWDEAEAVHKLHEHEARQLMCSVEVVVINKETDTTVTEQPVRAYVNMREGQGEGKYHSIINVLNDEQLRQRLLTQAGRELESWRNRYAQFEEAQDIWLTWQKKMARKGMKLPRSVKTVTPKRKAATA